MPPLMINFLITLFVVICFLVDVSTAKAAPPPASGQILQEIPAPPPLPTAPAPDLTLSQPAPAKESNAPPFEVRQIEITGNSLIPGDILHGLIADSEGKSLTLTDLNVAANRITDYYHSQGYPLTRAIIPAQTIRDGIVQIRVIEARFGKIALDNSSRVEDGLLNDFLSPLQTGEAITQEKLDHNLLLLSDVPGVTVDATLSAGAEVGSSDLSVKTAPTQPVNVYLSADDFGNRYTGRERFNGNVAYNNALHHGDVVSAEVLTSGEDLNYGRLGYQYLLNGEGTKVGGSYSALFYTLGDNLKFLKANGSAQVGSVFVSQPFVRQINADLAGQLQYDHKILQDHIDIAGIKTDRHSDDGTAIVSGDLRDGLLSGGSNTISFSYTFGHLAFDNADAAASDNATAKTQGAYSKLNLAAARLQHVTDKDSLSLSFNGQWANTNLDSSEQFILGGPTSVRAYDTSAASGAIGYLATAELRHIITDSFYGTWQAITFLDNGQVIVNQNIYASGHNEAMLSGTGVGLNWFGPDHWGLTTSIATPLGHTPALVGSSSTLRVWAQLSKQF